MRDRGLLPEFSPAAIAQAESAKGPASDSKVRDLRKLLWCSIDNDDSRDLDQLTVTDGAPGQTTKLLIAIADVDALVPKGSPIDLHAQHNTTSVYTGARIYPMLPERMSTDLTSLNPGEDRLAMVVELHVDQGGHISQSDVYRGFVHNHAKLAYNSVAAWLDGKGEEPETLKKVDGLADQLRLQDRISQTLGDLRIEQGALDLETIESRAVMQNGKVVDLEVTRKNRAREIIENFMIAANGVTARFLSSKGFASFRRVVRSPERWERIVALAEGFGHKLPPSPDSLALEEFLRVRRKADPVRFPDLSLSVVKLMGAGEYVIEEPGEKAVGHFGLAVKDYSHSTAPNRRYPDLVTQRLLKAALAGVQSPYSVDELDALAIQCTDREDDANKVERLVGKAAAALLLENRIGDYFDGIVTGASVKGTWVRIFNPPVEGKLEQGWDGLDVGDRVHVKLIGTEPERGFIDFARSR